MEQDWTLILAGAALVLSVFSAGHALLHKRMPRAAFVWIWICLSMPILGSFLYWMLGMNRIQTRARRLYGAWQDDVGRLKAPPFNAATPPRDHLAPLVQISDRVTSWPLLEGNQVEPYFNGDEAYPAMLEAIRGAQRTIRFQTYIFRRGAIGKSFLQELEAAKHRGVDVKVLLDGVGEWYSWPGRARAMRRRGISVAVFLPPSLLRPNLHMNLRNHRKILVVDGELGFTGGMNIGDGNLLKRAMDESSIQDLHFSFRGPVVAQVEQAFFEDWSFTVQKPFHDAVATVPPIAARAACRGILAGPNEDLDRLLWVIVGAVGAARQTVRVMTPYFIPPRDLIAALVGAALRGVKVQIVLPSRSNLPLMARASHAYFWELLEHGVEIYLRPPPFAHTKLLLVADEYSLVGSANLDPRSLRLNFEFDVEIFDLELAARLGGHFEETVARSHPVSLEEVQGRSLLRRAGDNAAKLFSPYL